MTKPPDPENVLRSGNSLQGDDYDLLSRKEVQDILGIGERFFYEYRQRYPSFKTVKVGNRVKMLRGTLKAFLKELEEEQAA